MRQKHQQFVDRNIGVVVIGADSAASFRGYWSKERMPFPGLPDPGGQVLASLGQEVNLLRLGRMPAQLVVDRSGAIRFAHYGASMSDIPAPDAVLAWFDATLGLGARPE